MNSLTNKPFSIEYRTTRNGQTRVFIYGRLAQKWLPISYVAAEHLILKGIAVISSQPER